MKDLLSSWMDSFGIEYKRTKSKLELRNIHGPEM